MFSDVQDILSVSKTCTLLRDVASNRHFWLNRLYELDQAHAPNLPPHLLLESLTWEEIRELVIKAYRRAENTGEVPKVTREVVIPIKEGNALTYFGNTHTWGADTVLLPGGRYFLIRWPVGYLQCWDVSKRRFLWTYPEVASYDSLLQEESITNYSCEVQSNGDINILVVCRNMEERTLRILAFSPDSNTLRTLSRFKVDNRDSIWDGLSVFAKLCGDVCALYTEGTLSITFWNERRTVTISECVFNTMDITDNTIICVTCSYDGLSLIAIPITPLRDSARRGGLSSKLRTTLSECTIEKTPINAPREWLAGRALLSVCKTHWKPRCRQEILITVLVDVYNLYDFRESAVAEYYKFNPHGILSKNTGSRGLIGADGCGSVFTYQGSSGLTEPNVQYSTFSVMTPPSQTGTTVLAFHVAQQRDTRIIRTISTYLRGQVTTASIVTEKFLERTPATYSLNVEFYSGALYYVTEDYQNVVVRYFD